MSIGKRLINTGAAAAAVCATDSADPFGDSSGLALYNLDYDASDASGNYDGTPTDVEFGVGGQINYGARFNGSSSKITLPTGSPFNDSDTIKCISAWIKPSTTTSNVYIYSVSSTTDTKDYFTFDWIQSTWSGVPDLRVRVQNNDSGQRLDALVGVTATDDWVHVVAQLGSSEVELYINGVKQTVTYTTSGSATNSWWINNITYSTSAQALIGQYRAVTPLNADGDIDQLRFFNRALLQSEIDTLYAETACVYTCTTDTVNYPTGTTPVAYYKLDNSAEDEGTNGNDGTWSGTEQYEFGRYGQAAVFNGSSSRIDLPNVLSGFTNVYTFSIWAKIDNTNNFPFFSSTASTAQSTYNNLIRFALHQNGDYYFSFGDIYGARLTGTSPSSWRDGNWHNFVFVSTSTEKLAYVDGSLFDSASSTKAVSGLTNIILGHYGTNYAGGSIDQVRIYDAALTSDQVTELYNEKQCFDTVTAPTANLRFDEFWAGYDDGASNRAEFKSSGQIVDFNTNSEGHAVLNQNAQTSGKYYLEIQLIGTSEHEYFGVFNRSSNTVYDVSPYVSRNPLDANYGAGLNKRGERTYIGNVLQSGFTDLNLGDNDIVCMAVDVGEKRIWFGRRDGLSDSSIVWSNGNPNGGYGGLSVSFVPSDVIVAHTSESTSRFAEFKVLNHADMLDAPFNFSYLNGDFTSTQTENEANF